MNCESIQTQSDISKIRCNCNRHCLSPDTEQIAPLEKRLIEWMRTLFFKDDLVNPVPFRQHGVASWASLRSLQTGADRTLLDAVFKDSSGNNKLDEPIDGAKTARDKLQDAKISGYLNGTTLATRFQDLNTTGQYWMRSGIAGFAPDAAQHFYLPERYTDPFDNVTTLEYDRQVRSVCEIQHG